MILSVIIIAPLQLISAASLLLSSSTSNYNYTYTFTGSSTSDHIGSASFGNATNYIVTDSTGEPVINPSSPPPADALIVFAPVNGSIAFDERVVITVDASPVLTVHTIQSTALVLTRLRPRARNDLPQRRVFLHQRRQQRASSSSRRNNYDDDDDFDVTTTNTQLTILSRWIVTAHSYTQLIASFDFIYGSLIVRVPIIHLEYGASLQLSGLQIDSPQIHGDGDNIVNVTRELRVRAAHHVSIHNNTVVSMHSDATIYLARSFGAAAKMHFYDNSKLVTMTNRGTDPLFICDNGADLWFHNNSYWNMTHNSGSTGDVDPRFPISFPVYDCDVIIEDPNSPPLEFGEKLHVDDSNDATIITTSGIILHGLQFGTGTRLVLHTPIKVFNDGSLLYEPGADTPWPAILELSQCTSWTQAIPSNDVNHTVTLNIDMMWTRHIDRRHPNVCVAGGRLPNATITTLSFGNASFDEYNHAHLVVNNHIEAYVPLLIRVDHTITWTGDVTNYVDYTPAAYIDTSTDDNTGLIKTVYHLDTMSPSVVAQIAIAHLVHIPSRQNLTFTHWPVIDLIHGGFHLYNESHLTFVASTVMCSYYCQWHTHAHDSRLPTVRFMNTTYIIINLKPFTMHMIADIFVAYDSRIIFLRTAMIKGRLIGSGVIESQRQLKIGNDLKPTSSSSCLSCAHMIVAGDSIVAPLTIRVTYGAFGLYHVNGTYLRIYGHRYEGTEYTFHNTILMECSVEKFVSQWNVKGQYTMWTRVNVTLPNSGKLQAIGDETVETYSRWDVIDSMFTLTYPNAYIYVKSHMQLYANGMVVKVTSSAGSSSFVRVRHQGILLVKSMTLGPLLAVSGNVTFVEDGHLVASTIICNRYEDSLATPTLFFPASTFTSQHHPIPLQCDTLRLHPQSVIIIHLDAAILTNATMIGARNPSKYPLIKCRYMQVADVTINIVLVQGTTNEQLPDMDIIIANLTETPLLQLLHTSVPRGSIILENNILLYRPGAAQVVSALTLLNICLSGGAALVLIAVMCCCCYRRHARHNSQKQQPLLLDDHHHVGGINGEPQSPAAAAVVAPAAAPAPPAPVVVAADNDNDGDNDDQ